MRGLTNQEPAESPPIRRRVLAHRQQARFAPLAQHGRELFCQRIEKRHPYRRDRPVLRRFRPLTAIDHRQVVVMMLSVLRRPIVIMVIMVIIIRATQQRVMHAAIRDSTMTQSNVPGGKEPAEQRQQSEYSTE